MQNLSFFSTHSSSDLRSALETIVGRYPDRLRGLVAREALLRKDPLAYLRTAYGDPIVLMDLRSNVTLEWVLTHHYLEIEYWRRQSGDSIPTELDLQTYLAWQGLRIGIRWVFDELWIDR